MHRWQRDYCLAHFVLHVLVYELDENDLGDTHEKAHQLLQSLEALEESECDEEFEAEMVEGIEALLAHEEHDDEERCEDDESESLVVISAEDAAILTGLFGADVEYQIRSSQAFQEHAMAFAVLDYLGDIAALFEQLAGFVGLNVALDSAIMQHGDSPETAELCDAWRDCDTIAFELRKESVLQWLMNADLVTGSFLESESQDDSSNAPREAVLRCLTLRDESFSEFQHAVEQAHTLLQPRLIEIARRSAPDSDEDYEIFDSWGNELDADTIALELSNAIDAMAKSPCRY